MRIIVELPDDIARRPDSGRQALEALAVEGYRSRKLTQREVGYLLGLSRIQTGISSFRMERSSGNFFENISVEADAYIFRNIIHDWDDEKALSILKTLRKATTARAMLVEWLIPDTPGLHLGKWTDITMMTG